MATRSQAWVLSSMAKQPVDIGQETFPWANPTGPSGRKVPARERLVGDRPQTQVKLAAYQAYLPEWLRILGQASGVRDLFVLDLFAGPGTYRDGVAGSPIIAADAAVMAQDSLRTRGYQITVHLRLVEKDDATRLGLRKLMSAYDGRLDYVVLEGTAEENAPQLIRESRGAATMALLDPDGIEIPYSLVRQFGNRRWTEALLSFDVQALLRNAEVEAGGAVNRFFGDDGSWRRCYGASGDLDVTALLELYRLTLARDRLFPYTAVHRIVFNSIHANRAIAQGCGSPKGTEKWLKAFKAAASKFDARLEEVAAPVERRAAMNRAVNQLRAYAGARDLTFADIYQRLLGLNLGEQDTHQVLLFLRERGLVQWSSRLHQDARPSPRFAFVPAYPDGIAWDGVERPVERPEVRVFAQ